MSESALGGSRRSGGPFSRRELDVLDLVSRGMTNTQAAAQLGITVHAIKFHLASIYRKLGVANRTEAAVAYTVGRTSPEFGTASKRRSFENGHRQASA